MINIAFIILSILYVIVAKKVDYWITISRLGFASECPQKFLEKENIYNFTSWGLFLAAIVSLFKVTWFPWWFGVIILAILWYLSGTIGKKTAFKKYREILRELAEEENNLEERDKIEQELNKSDSELLHEKL